MDLNIIITFIKYISINLCTSYSIFKLINKQCCNKLFITIISILLAFLLSITQNYFSTVFRITLIYLLYSFIISKITKNKLFLSILITIICMCLSYITTIISSSIVLGFIIFLTKIDYTHPLVSCIIGILSFVLIYLLFKIKRFKYGFPFIRETSNNEYLEIFVFIVTTIILFGYFLIGYYRRMSMQHIITLLLIYSIILIIVIQKTFVLYQKRKNVSKTLKEYETELAETKSKLQTALQEKHNLVKSNHEFYHRQEALKQKLNTLLQSQQSNYNSETSEEYSEILDRINNLSKEYANKIKSRPSLPKTNIPELDDMFTYLQSECEKYDIEFILKINADVNHMIETIIPKNKLETLIGDLIRNSIIAINHSNNEYKSIIAILGVKDNFFEFCVHDSGLEFEISTLLKLGTEPASTHTDNGGTGIGFITTFETLNYCKASLIINENIKEFNNYTKSLVIRFDNCNKYIVNSYRANIIRDCNNFRKDIIINYKQL